MKNINLIILMSITTLTSFSQGNNWKMNGSNNADTTSFAGTTNNIPFILKSNSIEGIRLNTNGSVRIFSLDDNLTTGIVIADNTGVLSKLSLTGNNDEVFTGAGSFISLSSLSGWSILGNVLSSGYYNVGINTTTAPEKLTVNGNILANGSISGTSINVVDIVTSGKEIKINTSVCLKGLDPLDPTSRNEICGMGGDFFVQSELNNNYNTIINYNNSGNVGIGINNPLYKLDVNGNFRAEEIVTNRIVGNDSIISFGDSTIHFNTTSQYVYGDFNSGNFRGTGLGLNAWARGKYSVAIGRRTQTTSNAEDAITIGAGPSTGFITNGIPRSLMIGFNSNIPTLFVSESSGNNTTGKVGISTTAPGDALQINGGTVKLAIGSVGFSTMNYGTSYLGFNAVRKSGGWESDGDGANNGGSVIYGDIGGNIHFIPVLPTGATTQTYSDAELLDNSRMIFYADGRLGVNTTCVPWDVHLAVNGKINCEEVLIKLANAQGCWPDYVFDENHVLKPLEKVDEYNKENKHLEGFPSAKEIEEGGITVSKIEIAQTKKIEELFLYVINLNERVKDLEKENAELKKQVSKKKEKKR